MNAIIKLKKEKMGTDFLADGSLTWRAKGVISMVIHAPESWNGTLMGMVNYSSEGHHTLQKCFKELEEKGYARIFPPEKRGKPALLVLSTT